MTTVEIQTNLQWKVLRARGGKGNWVAVSDALKLTVESETWAEMMEDIGLAINAMLTDLLETNDLENFLRQHGWVAVGPIPRQPGEVRFDVPFIPVPVNASGLAHSLH
jgi:hypothetical protein